MNPKQRVKFKYWRDGKLVDDSGVFLGWTTYGADNELGAIVGVDGGKIKVVLSENITFPEEFPDPLGLGFQPFQPFSGYRF